LAAAVAEGDLLPPVKNQYRASEAAIAAAANAEGGDKVPANPPSTKRVLNTRSTYVFFLRSTHVYL